MRRDVVGPLRKLHGRLLVMLIAFGALGIGVWTDAQSASGQSTASAARTAKHFPARLVKVMSGFAFPTYLTATPADPNAFYVVERAGRIQIVRNGHRVAHPFLDITRLISIGPTSEEGLLSMAFDPNYAVNGAYYVDYTDNHGNIVVAQFHRAKNDPSRTNSASERIVLRIGHPPTGKHFAGQLQFGPRDHDLYISTGDGGEMAGGNGTAQHLDSLLGKILRIDVHHRSRHHLYRIPKGNPFAHRKGALPQIYAYGLRNPYRFSFDSKTRAVWIGDVGENTWEEIDYRKPRRFAGTNFGWPRFEGPVFFRNIPAPGHITFPVISKHHYGGTAGSHEHWCAVMGGFVERDPRIPRLAGHYLFADHCSGEIDVARINKKGHAYGVVPTGISIGGLPNSFGVDAQQRLYVVTVSGTIYRFVKR